MVTQRPVILIANDVVPGMGLPVAAPGLRVLGIAEGLRAHGYEVTTVVASGPVETAWNGQIPAPSSDGVIILGARYLAGFIEANSPATVILTNSNQVDHLEESDGVAYILDFFAPKMLELANSTGAAEYPTERLAALRRRKIRAIEMSSGFVVNGRKKLPYFLAWLLQTDIDVRTVPYSVVEMCVPNRFRDRPEKQHVELAMAGFLQGWSRPGEWLSTLTDMLEVGRAHLNVLMPEHWGQAERVESTQLDDLFENRAIFRHNSKNFSDFQDWMSTMDVAVDLFTYNTEREFAMVTRTIVALACGVPVVHPSFTEVSPMINGADAGWIVDPGNAEGVAATFEEILSDPDGRALKAQNARKLWRQRLDPVVAVKPLVEMLEQLDG